MFLEYIDQSENDDICDAYYGKDSELKCCSTKTNWGSRWRG
jgi:hypothetical protein